MVTEHILTSLTRKRKIADAEVQDFALVDSSSEQTDFDFEEALEAHDRAEAARGGPVPAEDELPDPRTLHEDEASNEAQEAVLRVSASPGSACAPADSQEPDDLCRLRAEAFPERGAAVEVHSEGRAAHALPGPFPSV